MTFPTETPDAGAFLLFLFVYGEGGTLSIARSLLNKSQNTWFISPVPIAGTKPPRSCHAPFLRGKKCVC